MFLLTLVVFLVERVLVEAMDTNLKKVFVRHRPIPGFGRL